MGRKVWWGSFENRLVSTGNDGGQPWSIVMVILKVFSEWLHQGSHAHPAWGWSTVTHHVYYFVFICEHIHFVSPMQVGKYRVIIHPILTPKNDVILSRSPSYLSGYLTVVYRLQLPPYENPDEDSRPQNYPRFGGPVTSGKPHWCSMSRFVTMWAPTYKSPPVMWTLV